MSPTVLGLDLSLTATGLSDGQRTWLVKSTGHRGDTLAVRSIRLSHLRTAVLEQAHGADLVVVEGPSHGQARQGGQHDRAGLWWHVVGALLDTGTPVAEVPPATLKRYATGKGNAGKGAVIEATTRRYPQVLTDGDDNRCDALWLAVNGPGPPGAHPTPPTSWSVPRCWPGSPSTWTTSRWPAAPRWRPRRTPGCSPAGCQRRILS